MMVEESKDISMNEEEEYELLPQKEIEELKDELRKLKEFEITPTKKLRVSLLELNTKLDKLLKIFDEAQHTMRQEEMGMTFKERMRPVLDKMDKMLEQNSDIAEGIVAIADMVKEARQAPPKAPEEEIESEEMPDFGPVPPMPAPRMPAPGVPPPAMPPRPQMPSPRVQQPMPPPAAPQRKRTFGII